mgnify:CR=1 FL=1
METKKILGLDLGTNSIGWAVVEAEENENGLQPHEILKAGSRIIPMKSDMLSKFCLGQTASATKERTQARSIRRMIDRHQLRRERLNRVLNILGYLPKHYADCLDSYGKIIKGQEPKLAWKVIDGKYQFMFMDSYNEMLDEFSRVHPELIANGKKIAYDWTIYYLRKKALYSPLTRQELAWLLLQFNQKRGYNQSRTEEIEQTETEQKELQSLRIIKVELSSEKKKGQNKYLIHLENGLIAEETSRTPIDWEGQIRDFIITTTYDVATGKIKNQAASLPDPKKDQWELLKVRTESNLRKRDITPGEYIYSLLLVGEEQKVVGDIVRTIDRCYYRDELKRILNVQKQHLPELQDEVLYRQAINALYPTNKTHRNHIVNQDWTYLLLDDVLFYQRPLKSKKYLIASCPFEEHVFVDKLEHKLKQSPIHVIPKSHPLYEEFRTWNYVHNVRVVEQATGKDVTNEYLGSHEQRASLFSFLYAKKEVNQESLLNALGIKPIKKADKKTLSEAEYAYSWKYDSDYKMECAQVCAELRAKLKKSKIDISVLAHKMRDYRTTNHLQSQWGDVFLNEEQEVLTNLWHLCYSINNQREYKKALTQWSKRYELGDLFVETFSKLKPFPSIYGAYSERAISRLLPLMREGEYWSADRIDPIGVVENSKKEGCKSKDLHPTFTRIQKIISGEVDESISLRTREQVKDLETIEQFQGLPDWKAAYVVYNRSSEAKLVTKWNSPDDITKYIKEFRHHSLNNPVVEKVVLETLRVVRDIFSEYNAIDEIHIELARELKKNAKARKKMAEEIKDNANAKQRARDMLNEMFNNPDIEGIRTYSAKHIEKIRVIEDAVLTSALKTDANDAINMHLLSKWKGKNKPTPNEIRKYCLWLEQRYQSPYTGQPIPFSRLFTKDYQVDHVVPQSLFFDDSLSNKVVCEAEVNADKDNKFGLEYIRTKKCGTVSISNGRKVSILSEESYRTLVERMWKHNPRKLRNMLRTNIPEDYGAHQMNDTRYISKLVMILLSNIVRETNVNGQITEQEVKSKKVVVTNGNITDRLKQDWGINEVWNKIILPRFERMNNLLNTDQYLVTTKNNHTIPNIPDNPNLDKKRIDHRHHAMDAIVIACTTQNHVNLLNNISANDSKEGSRYDLQVKLRKRESYIKDGEQRFKFTEFKKPWKTITEDTFDVLNNMVTSSKQDLRVLKHGKKQQCGISWGICRSLHAASGYGRVNLQEGIVYLPFQKAVMQINRIVNKDLRKKVRELLSLNMSMKQIEQYFKTERDVWSDVDVKKIGVYKYSEDGTKHYAAKRKNLINVFEDCVKDYLDASDKKDAIVAQKKIVDNTVKIIKSITDSGIQEILTNHFTMMYR